MVGVKQDSQAVADKPACLQELTLFFFFSTMYSSAQVGFYSLLNPYQHHKRSDPVVYLHTSKN